MHTSLTSDTSSVVCVPLDPEHDAAELFQAAIPLRETLQYLAQAPREETLAAFRVWLRWHTQDSARVCWTIRLAADGTVVGEAYLLNVFTIPESGMWIGPRWQGTRVFQDTLALLCEEAFGARNFHRLQLAYTADNVRMRQIMERLAMPVEGVLREAFDNGDGTWSDIIVTSFLRTQWTGMPRDKKSTLKEAFARMAGNFCADRAAGVDAIVQYEIEGEGGGTWNAVMKDGACTVTEGAVSRPNLVLKASVQDWLDISARRRSAYALFLSRKLRIKGDMELALRLRTFFSGP